MNRNNAVYLYLAMLTVVAMIAVFFFVIIFFVKSISSAEDAYKKNKSEMAAFYEKCNYENNPEYIKIRLRCMDANAGSFLNTCESQARNIICGKFKR